MVNLKILVPDGTTNYITNPALRYDTTGWSLVGSTLTRSLDYARFGIASLKVVTAGTAMREGAYFRVNGLSGINTPITASVYVRGSGRVRLRLIDNPRGKEWPTAAIALSSARWTRLEVSGFSTGSDDLRLYVETYGTAKAITFYLDGAQIEAKSYATTYCDGDQPGCRWNLIAHGSVSTRDPYTRQGGRWVPVAGSCREDDNLYVTSLGGLGMASMVNNTQAWANAPGAYYQNTKVTTRPVTLSFHVKNRTSSIVRKANLSSLHGLRQQLIDLIKPDKTQGGEAFLFEYSEGDRPLYLWMRYEAGLEGEWDIRNPFVNSFPVRFTVVDPLFYEDNYNVQQLSFTRTIKLDSSGGEGDCFGRINGEWNPMQGAYVGSTGYQLNGEVDCLAIGTKGEIYAGGNFNVAGVTRIAKWDGSRWTVIGAGGANERVYAIAVAPNGDIYAAGAFTSIGGVAANRIAKWNGTTWSALSTGLSGPGHALCFAPNGMLYIGGNFATVGGVAMTNICMWDGSQFRKCGTTNGVTGPVYALVYARGKIYLGGAVTASGAYALDKVAALDINTNLFERIPGFDDTVYAMRVSRDGKIYAAGDFTETSSSPAIPLNGVAVYTGTSWSALGDGVIDAPLATVRAIEIGNDGLVYVGGGFTTLYDGFCTLRNIAVWNGITWASPDVSFSANLSTAGGIYSLLQHPNGDIYVGLVSSSLPSVASAMNYVINSGTSETAPIFYFRGSGILKYIENQTTQKRIYFYYPMAATEEVVIDCGKGTVISSSAGNIMNRVIRGGDFQNFTLIPGENKLAVFMSNDVSGLAQVGYKPMHWSADAVKDAEEL